MSKRLGRAQRATALVPLALLSAAWTANLAGVGAGSATATGSNAPSSVTSLPDGTTVPTEAIDAPASVSSPDGVAPGIGSGGAAQAVSTASTAAIPSAALAAYQRAETVINAADKSCNVSWQLVAAVGRVESDHGRYAGNTLDDQGVATPGIYGIALDGSRNTQAIRDTDAGQFDNDVKWDRAVGPMQFIPSTWSVVGVDADGDDARNPQDIDDAALASAVYLCSGDDDLSTVAGQRAAVYRYNHSQSYVDLVLSIMNAYLDGEYTSVPNGTTAAGYIVPDPGYTPPPSSTKPPQGTGNQGTIAPTPSTPSSPQEPTTPTQPGATQPPAPGTPGTPGGEGGNGGTKPPKLPDVKLPPLPEPVEQTLTYAQAVTQCALDYGLKLDLSGALDVVVKLITNLIGASALNACVDKYMNP
ncbi:lytic transglycosylase domain-containing protein [Nocardioides dongkuii]|uniref:lytic transglycosylase domain-containing protein n=1 Tax=Nocardioides dongkuii TaxID=2760089 RepID=UPI0015FD851D|nr:lytic transglycosylase domain-containing protein [Nocardioides dongkuii]